MITAKEKLRLESCKHGRRISSSPWRHISLRSPRCSYKASTIASETCALMSDGSKDVQGAYVSVEFEADFIQNLSHSLRASLASSSSVV